MKSPNSHLWIASSLLGVALTLSAVSTTQAETLYKWREADGSLTFSPKPPPEGSGIRYELVGGDAQPALGSGTASTPVTSLPVAPVLNPAPVAQAATRAPVSNLQPQRPPQRQRTVVPTNRKSVHCEELRKRVISLERLLRTELSAETMDNAVVQMARYQTGINKACN